MGVIAVKIKFVGKPRGTLLNVGKEIIRAAIITLPSHNSFVSHTPTNVTYGSI